MNPKILYEDENIVVIDKPVGLKVHGDGKNKEYTVADWFLAKYPESSGVGESIFNNGTEVKKPGVVHRLDGDTSGVLLLVKNQDAYEYFKNLFKDRKIKKIYNAIVNGYIRNDFGFIDKPIGRSPRDFRKRLAGRGARGELREAVTEYRALNRFEEDGNKYTFLELRPKTGRMHQLRVHLKFLNHPIVGDSLYNPGKSMPSGIDRMALHARSLEFEHMNGEVLKLESPLPEGFERFAAS